MSSVEWGGIWLNVHFSGLGYFSGFVVSVGKISKVGLVQLSEYDSVPFSISHGIRDIIESHTGMTEGLWETGPLPEW